MGLARFMPTCVSFGRYRRSPISKCPSASSILVSTNITLKAGSAAGQYFHQDLLIAQRIFEAKPARHVDVASRIDGFVAHLGVFRQVEVFDIRPLTTSARNIIFRRCDLTADIEPEFVDYCDFISCLHALEHFGLGPIRR